MATHRQPLRIVGVVVASGAAYPSSIFDQITEAASSALEGQDCYVCLDNGTDQGVYVRGMVPKNYVGTPKLVVRGIIDGAPSAAHTLGFAFQKRAPAVNASADVAYDAEQTTTETIGSDGANYSDEDEYEASITLTAGDYAADRVVYGRLVLDSSGTTFTGNFLLTEVFLEFTDA